MQYAVLQSLFEKLFQSDLWVDGFSVVWHAGEPLVVGVDFYDQAFALIERIRPSNCAISHSIQSNGLLIDSNWCDLFTRYNVKVGLSVDGPSFLHDSHRKTRNGTGTHDAVLRAMDLLSQRHIPFHTISVVTRSTLRYPEAFFLFFVRHGVNRIGFNIEEIEGAHGTSSLSSHQHSDNVSEEDRECSAKQVEKEFRSFVSRLFRLARQYPDVHVREFDNAIKFLFHSNGVISSDVTPVRQIQVDVDGNVSCFSPELLGMKSDEYGNFHFGNIIEDDLEQIFGNDKYFRVRDDIAAGVKSCKDSCEYFFLCGGGSPSNKYFENGTFRSTETMHCRLTKQVSLEVVLDELQQVKNGNAKCYPSRTDTVKSEHYPEQCSQDCPSGVLNNSSSLQSDVGIFRACDWDLARVQVNSGVYIVDRGNGRSSGVFHPNRDWRTPSSDELSSLLVQRVRSLSNTVCIFRIDTALVDRFYEFGLDALQYASKEHFDEIYATVFQDYWREVYDYLTGNIFAPFNPCSLAVNFTNPGRESSSYSSERGGYIGLHIDNWGEPKGGMSVRHLQGVRIGINIGQESRDVVFINLSAHRMVEMSTMLLSPVERKRMQTLAIKNNASPFVAFFVEAFQNYPVTRFSLQSGEAYIMPVNNIIHNGYPADKSYVDTNLQISCHAFKLLPAIENTWGVKGMKS